MERFVFVAAIVFAGIFALVSMVGARNWHFEIDDDGGRKADLVDLAPGRMEPQTYQASSVRVRHAAARIVVTAEDRTDYVVEIDNPGGAPMPEVTLEGGRLDINGLLRGRIRECLDDGAELEGYGTVAAAQLPLITIRGPRRLDVGVSGASVTEIGATEALDVSHSGCGATTVGDVTQELNVDLAGTGRLVAGSARRLDVDLGGTGEVRTGAIAEGAEVDSGGTGTVDIAALNGPLTVDLGGTGSVIVRAGVLTDVDVDLGGTGDVTITGSVARLNASVAGPGEVAVNGAVGDLDAEIMGPGVVRAQSVSGSLRQQVFGPGSVRVGN